MTIISLEINPQEEKLIKEYTKTKNISVLALFSDTVLEKIEDEVDLNSYKQTMQECTDNPESISFEEMFEQLSN